MLSKPGNSTPTVGRQTMARKRIGKSVTGLVLTPGLCLKFGPIMIRPLILTSGFLTELGDVFAGRAFPPTKIRSATLSELGCFRRADAPATLVRKPTPNFAAGLALIPSPCPRSVRIVRRRILKIEARIECFDNESGVSLHELRAGAPRKLPITPTNARFAALHGLPVGPVSLSTPPAPLRKPRARHERASAMCRKSGGFRLRLGGGRCAPRFVPLGASLRPPLHFPRPPTADRSSPTTQLRAARRGNPRSTLAFHSEGWRVAIPNAHGRE